MVLASREIWRWFGSNKDQLALILGAWGAILSTFSAVRTHRKESKLQKRLKLDVTADFEPEADKRRPSLVVRFRNASKVRLKIESISFRYVGSVDNSYVELRHPTTLPRTLNPGEILEAKAFFLTNKDANISSLFARDAENNCFYLGRRQLKKLNKQLAEARAKIAAYHE